MNEIPEKPLKEKTSITLDAEVLNQIKIMAYEDERSFSQYVNLILKEWMRTHQKNDHNT